MNWALVTLFGRMAQRLAKDYFVLIYGLGVRKTSYSQCFIDRVHITLRVAAFDGPITRMLEVYASSTAAWTA